MSPASAQPIALTAHPSNPGEAVSGIDARVHTGGRGILRLEYLLRADLSRVVVPGLAAMPGRADELWKHTCFEAFIAPARSRARGDADPAGGDPHSGARGDPHSGEYYELNFAPSGRWAAYHFAGYRRNMSHALLTAAPQIIVRCTPQLLELSVTMPLPEKLAATSMAGARLGLAVVVEEDNGRLSYWALRHPVDRPDFHQLNGFVLEPWT